MRVSVVSMLWAFWERLRVQVDAIRKYSASVFPFSRKNSWSRRGTLFQRAKKSKEPSMLYGHHVVSMNCDTCFGSISPCSAQFLSNIVCPCNSHTHPQPTCTGLYTTSVAMTRTSKTKQNKNKIQNHSSSSFSRSLSFTDQYHRCSTPSSPAVPLPPVDPTVPLHILP